MRAGERRCSSLLCLLAVAASAAEPPGAHSANPRRLTARPLLHSVRSAPALGLPGALGWVGALRSSRRSGRKAAVAEGWVGMFSAAVRSVLTGASRSGRRRRGPGSAPDCSAPSARGRVRQRLLDGARPNLFSGTAQARSELGYRYVRHVFPRHFAVARRRTLGRGDRLPPGSIRRKQCALQLGRLS